ncbi:hypothetical protein GOV06_02970 [Candidatus Woesearchaeota archaeon]|nr:hypothetical protein [Candidatus Woesearchaeota archaeon]
MKTIILVLLIGLFILVGCGSTNVQQQTTQQQTDISPEPEQNQQQAESGNIPRPPALPEE